MPWIILLISLFFVGCNATCLRDSDCLGTSICTDNRCILIVRSDAGRRTPSTPETEPPITPDDSAGDAGASE